MDEYGSEAVGPLDVACYRVTDWPGIQPIKVSFSIGVSPDLPCLPGTRVMAMPFWDTGHECVAVGPRHIILPDEEPDIEIWEAVQDEGNI